MKAFLVILNAVVNIFKRTFLAYKYKIIDYKCLTPLATIFQLKYYMQCLSTLIEEKNKIFVIINE
jgi:hypothetical protein